jgi:predicted Ser/Thr protein kinase
VSENNQVDPLEETRAESIQPGKLLAGAPIGGYELQHVLGEGGMGVVWCAHDPLLDRTIAIKVLKSRDVGASMRTRLLREAQAMAQIKHPNVLTVHRVGTEGDRDFIVMELVDGGPLDHWLAFGPPEDEVMAALLAAGRGLAAAHAAGLVHRDFKPNNVLRSKTGRVLVTDFGLARGLGERDWSSPVGPTGSLDPEAKQVRDSVLDSTLTKTGALIGTPAYMAPEQFEGSEPDPRTDQYAFCVTAWQALTGARPHHGRTLDELRQAANQGVGGVISILPKQMRIVLARGLDPDPAKRWPDLETLLREFERAGTPKKQSRLPWIAGAIAAIAIAVVAYVATRGAAGPVCDPVDTVWANAWSKLSLAEPHAHLGATLDDHEKRWIATYDQTCKAASARPVGRLVCLQAVRSRIALVANVLAKDPSTRPAIDPLLFLVPPEVCSGRPAAMPVVPDDPRIVDVLARAIVMPTSEGLAKEAKATGWTPLGSLVTAISGLRRVHDGDIAAGRAELERALASPADPRLEAYARLGILAASLEELAHPEDYPGSKPDTMHEEIARLLTYARSAVKAANEEPVLAGMLALFEAEALADLAERAPRKASYGDAIARAIEARRSFETAGDLKRAARAAALVGDIHLRRGELATLGDAEFVVRGAADTLERAKLPPIPIVDQVLGRIAYARNDTGVAHRWLDRASPPRPAVTGTPITGVVLGPDGKPVMNAVVVAWVGELHGDPVRAFTDRGTVDGEIVETSAEGKFTIHHRSATVVVAEALGGTLRSVPVATGSSSTITLRLAATGEVSGRIETAITSGVDGYARMQIGEASWFVRAPIEKGAAFRIGGLPPGTWQVGAIGSAGTATRRIAAGGATLTAAAPNAGGRKLVWPGGRTIDVVVRGTKLEGATAWIVDAGDLARYKVRDDFEVVAASSDDGTSSKLFPIGSRYTDPGRQHYLAGMRHAIFVGDYQDAAACVAPSAAGDAAVVCKKLEPDARAIAIDVP